MKRSDGRAFDELRPLTLTTGVNPHAEGSCLVKCGQTEVLVTASLLRNTPKWLKGKGQGWLTAEYGMLPRATADRKDREAVKGRQEGRTQEIQRLIGRSLRAVCDLKKLDGYTLHLDCDVLVADGGTRTASITGAFVAASLAARELQASSKLSGPLFSHYVAAISCGIHDTNALLDMDYLEDSTTQADGNFIMTDNGHWIEQQITAELFPLSDENIASMQRLARLGINKIIELQKSILE